MKIGKPFPASLSVYGTHEGIRTSDLPLRRRSLYPAELHGHIDFFYSLGIVSQFQPLVNLESRSRSSVSVRSADTAFLRSA